VADARETHYVRSADGTNLAYHLGRGGPRDLVFLHGFAVPIDLLSEDPAFVRLRKRLDTFSRTVWFDRRGSPSGPGTPGRRDLSAAPTSPPSRSVPSSNSTFVRFSRLYRFPHWSLHREGNGLIDVGAGR
jgi:hypothetical protein